jgi:putative ABC transport system substrate-binding protein
MRRVAVITNSVTPDLTASWNAMKALSSALDIQLTVFDVRQPSDLAEAVERMRAAAIQGIVMQDDFMLNGLVEAGDSPLTAFVMEHRLPMTAPGMAKGVLITYAFNWDVQFRQVAKQVHALIRGAKAGELPVEQPTNFQLIVNLKLAKEFGIAIPRAVLVRADNVVQ